MAVLRCPQCREKFPWNLKESGFPDECPICEGFIGSGRSDSDICMPSIRGMRSATASTDAIYREMERASENNAHAAAEMAGVHVSEMSNLKLTNMRDGMKQGDIAAPPLQGSAAALEQHMAQMAAKGAQVGFGGMGLSYSQASPIGPQPSAGARFMGTINDAHADNVAKYCVGRDETGRPVVPSTDVRSHRPANELFQPGYVPRARW